MTTRGRPSGKVQHLERVLDLYRVQGMSMSAIAREIGIGMTTVRQWLIDEGVEIDPYRGLSAPRGPLSDAHKAKLSETKSGVSLGTRAAWKGIERTCPECGKTFMPKADKQVLCSVQCRNIRGTKANRVDRSCPCGNELPSFSQTHSLYCSEECRAKYGKPMGRQRDDAKWKTRTCRNCDKSFEIRTSSRSPGHYCSNECAKRHTKTTKHYAVDGFDIVFESSYEAFVWGALKIAKVPVERFDRRYTINGYGPDLWVPSMKLAIECKGLVDADDEARWAAYREHGRLLVLTRSDLLTLSPESLVAML